MGKHRTAGERLEALQSQILSLQIKAQRDEISKNPKVMEVNEKINSLNNLALKWKRWQKDADQKISDFTARVAEWEHRKESAEEWLEEYAETLSELKAQREEISEQALKELSVDNNG
jgi:arylsulfatase A-like enzyme